MVHLEKLLRKNVEAKKTMGVLMLDIDHFKQINDTYGHGAGDEVLKIFAERMLLRLRSFDLVVRLGGEEFVVVLPDISQNMAIHVAERLRTGICSSPFRVDVAGKPTDIKVSTSIGGALIEAGEVNVDDVLQLIDEELYKAKEDGRNCTYFTGQGLVTLPDHPIIADIPEETTIEDSANHDEA